MSMPRRRRRDREPLTGIAGTPATVPAATGEMPNQVESLASEPTHEDIARRAYQLFEDRGGDHGHDWEDWLRAERELRQLALHRVLASLSTTGGAHAAA